ncbi:MAG: transglutaminase domain-containing protein [Candidatus Eisenbacteria bacterium]|nr:transglutaminase domain-containing protein [Candidatus Eisenbacteria bacterium]
MKKSKSLIFGLLACGWVAISMASYVFAATGDVEKSFPTPRSCPTGLTFDGKYLWNCDRKTDMLYKIDPDNGKVVDSLSSPGFHPLGLAWDGKFLWNVDAEDNLIFQIDAKTGLAVKTLTSPSQTSDGLAWDGKFLWITDLNGKQIQQVSTDDGTTITSIPAPSSNPSGLAYDGKYLWVSDRISNMIYMVTPDNGDVVLFFDAPGPYARGLAWDGTSLWNVDYQTDQVYKLTVRGKETFTRSDEKLEFLEYTNQVRNYGPGVIKDLDVYLAVPENLNNQEIVGQIEYYPPPNDFLTDRWGQKVAHYKFQNLEATKFSSVSMKVKTRLYKIRYFIFPEMVGSLKDIPKSITDKYLADDTKYSLSDPFIQKSAKEAVGDETNPYWIARKIFSYVIGHMEYQLAGGWNIAPTVLKRGTGSCSEYSFVYIALCLASGLPARYVGSVVIRGDDASDDDVFHRWVEVYLPNYGWIPVDPSGGDNPSPSAQANAIGNLNNRYLITTTSGGGSEYLEWTYNSNERWTSLGRCKVRAESIGEWSPAK